MSRAAGWVVAAVLAGAVVALSLVVSLAPSPAAIEMQVPLGVAAPAGAGSAAGFRVVVPGPGQARFPGPADFGPAFQVPAGPPGFGPVFGVPAVPPGSFRVQRPVRVGPVSEWFPGLRGPVCVRIVRPVTAGAPPGPVVIGPAGAPPGPACVRFFGQVLQRPGG